jgi:predicted AlkP superfamily phosphohydrolase/phosphomutase
MARTLIVGFDGVPLDLAERWVADGRMPNLRAIFTDGSYGRMRSAFPYNSAVAWTSLSTGVDPGRHGIYDFVLPADSGYGLRVATRRDRRVPALWTYASRAAARVAVINIPMTFPAEAVNGVMVSGMDAPRLEERAVHPSEDLDALKARDYRIISRAALHAGKREWARAERELLETLAARNAYVLDLARPRDLDLIMVNLESTDGAHHFFWQHHDPTHPRHDPALAGRFGDAIGRVYEASDRELGRLIETYGPDTVFVVSDHGGGPTNDWILFMNDWLGAEGFLTISRDRAAGLTRKAYGAAKRKLSVPARRALRPVFGRLLDEGRRSALYGGVDWSTSRAYAQMQPALRVNQAGREPQGIVTPDERDEVIAEVIERARAARFPEGGPIFEWIRPADEVYAGDEGGGFDIVMELAAGTHIRSRNTTSRPGWLHRLEDLDMYLPSGVHTPFGMVAAAGSGIAKRGRVADTDIHQAAASVLAVMGVAHPELDGDPFAFVTANEAASRRGTDAMAPPDPVASPETELTPEEEGAVLERLRGLGYVD